MRPSPKGEAALGAALGARPAYMEAGGWLEMLVVGGIADMDAGEEEREAKGDRPG